MTRFYGLFLLITFFPVTGFTQQKKAVKESNDSGLVSRNDLKKIYDEFNVDGMFALYNLKEKSYIFYNPSFYKQPVSPASTFNILLTLIGLEEGIIRDEKSLLQPNNTTVEYAFRHNVDSCFINLSLLIGERKIEYWLNRINYGNKTTSGEHARFWINGFLQITPQQQLGFIKKFYFGRMPFSKMAFNIVKDLMHESADIAPGLSIYGKRGSNKVYKENEYTGNLYPKDKYTGWFVGYIEGSNNTYFFINYIESCNLHHPEIVHAQKEIAFRIFKELELK